MTSGALGSSCCCLVHIGGECVWCVWSSAAGAEATTSLSSSNAIKLSRLLRLTCATASPAISWEKEEAPSVARVNGDDAQAQWPHLSITTEPFSRHAASTDEDEEEQVNAADAAMTVVIVKKEKDYRLIYTDCLSSECMPAEVVVRLLVLLMLANTRTDT